jgi:hypothetical protein
MHQGKPASKVMKKQVNRNNNPNHNSFVSLRCLLLHHRVK